MFVTQQINFSVHNYIFEVHQIIFQWFFDLALKADSIKIMTSLQVLS